MKRVFASMNMGARVPFRLLLGALLLLLSVGGWLFLSRSFIYGTAHAERPILLFLLFYGLAWLGLFLGLSEVCGRGSGRTLGFILTVAVLARVLLIPSGLILEHDVYRYLLDGNVLIRGENPYRWAPEELPGAGSDRLRRDLEAQEAAQVLERVAYPWIPTVYPPAAQGAFALGALLGGWNWMGLRVLFLMADLLVLLGILIFSRLSKLPSERVLFYAWNPLVLKEIANSAHLDVLVALFLVLLCIALLLFRRSRRPVWLWAGAGFGALAVLTKLYPLLLLPACCLWLRRNGASPGRILQFVLLGGGLVCLAYLPFLGPCWREVFEGLESFASIWIMNQGAFELLTWLPAPRIAAAGLVLLAAFWIPWVRLREDGGSLVDVLLWVLTLWFLLLPTGFPWYAVPLIALAALRLEASRLFRPVLLLSGVFAAYYLVFYFEYHHYPMAWWSWARRLEHGVVWATLLWSVARTSPPVTEGGAPQHTWHRSWHRSWHRRPRL